MYTSCYLLEATSYFFVTVEDQTFQFYQTLWPNVCHPKITIYLHFGKELIVENSHPYKVVFPLIWPPKLGENFISYCLLCCFMVRRCGGVDPPAQSDLAARQTTFDHNLPPSASTGLKKLLGEMDLTLSPIFICKGYLGISGLSMTPFLG